MASTSGDSQTPINPHASIIPLPDIINWPVQKQKVRRERGQAINWVDIRRVAEAAVKDALKTLSLKRLIDVVKGPCRDAGFKASRDKEDKYAELKREYYNMVMDILEDALEQEVEKIQASDKEARYVPLTCRIVPRGIAAKSNPADTEATGKDTTPRDTEHQNTQQEGQKVDADMLDLAHKIEGLHLKAAEKQRQNERRETETQNTGVEVAQHTAIYSGLIRSLLHPAVHRVPDHDDEDGWETEDADLDSWLDGLNEDELRDLEEVDNADLELWIEVEEERESGWVAVLPERP